MTREQIVDGLALLADQLTPSDRDAQPPPPADWTVAEWAYLRGIAAGELLRLRDRLASGRVVTIDSEIRTAYRASAEPRTDV